MPDRSEGRRFRGALWAPLKGVGFLAAISMSGAIAVTVKLFATLRQQAGWGEQQMSVPSGCTLGELMTLITEATPDLKLTGRAVYAAVNQSYAKMDLVLNAGDVVAIFPPVSGGAFVGGIEKSQAKR